MKLTFSVIFWCALVLLFVIALCQQALAAKRGKPQLFGRPLWVVLIYDCGFGLCLVGTLAPVFTDSGTAWHSQIVSLGVGMIGVGAESEVVASLLGRPTSAEIKNWGTRIGIGAMGLVFMYLGFGKAVGLG